MTRNHPRHNALMRVLRVSGTCEEGCFDASPLESSTAPRAVGVWRNNALSVRDSCATCQLQYPGASQLHPLSSTALHITVTPAKQGTMFPSLCVVSLGTQSLPTTMYPPLPHAGDGSGGGLPRQEVVVKEWDLQSATPHWRDAQGDGHDDKDGAVHLAIPLRTVYTVVSLLSPHGAVEATTPLLLTLRFLGCVDSSNAHCIRRVRIEYDQVPETPSVPQRVQSASANRAGTTATPAAVTTSASPSATAHTTAIYTPKRVAPPSPPPSAESSLIEVSPPSPPTARVGTGSPPREGDSEIGDGDVVDSEAAAEGRGTAWPVHFSKKALAYDDTKDGVPALVLPSEATARETTDTHRGRQPTRLSPDSVRTKRKQKFDIDSDGVSSSPSTLSHRAVRSPSLASILDECVQRCEYAQTPAPTPSATVQPRRLPTGTSKPPLVEPVPALYRSENDVLRRLQEALATSKPAFASSQLNISNTTAVSATADVHRRSTNEPERRAHEAAFTSRTRWSPSPTSSWRMASTDSASSLRAATPPAPTTTSIATTSHRDARALRGASSDIEVWVWPRHQRSDTDVLSSPHLATSRAAAGLVPTVGIAERASFTPKRVGVSATAARLASRRSSPTPILDSIHWVSEDETAAAKTTFITPTFFSSSHISGSTRRWDDASSVSSAQLAAKTVASALAAATTAPPPPPSACAARSVPPEARASPSLVTPSPPAKAAAPEPQPVRTPTPAELLRRSSHDDAAEPSSPSPGRPLPPPSIPPPAPRQALTALHPNVPADYWLVPKREPRREAENPHGPAPAQQLAQHVVSSGMASPPSVPPPPPPLLLPESAEHMWCLPSTISFHARKHHASRRGVGDRRLTLSRTQNGTDAQGRPTYITDIALSKKGVRGKIRVPAVARRSGKHHAHGQPRAITAVSPGPGGHGVDVRSETGSMHSMASTAPTLSDATSATAKTSELTIYQDDLVEVLTGDVAYRSGYLHVDHVRSPACCLVLLCNNQLVTAVELDSAAEVALAKSLLCARAV